MGSWGRGERVGNPGRSPRQRVVIKFTKLSKIGFCMECFIPDFTKVPEGGEYAVWISLIQNHIYNS